MNKIKYMFQGLHSFFLLWSTQALSSLGSGMTSYSLVKMCIRDMCSCPKVMSPGTAVLLQIGGLLFLIIIFS